MNCFFDFRGYGGFDILRPAQVIFLLEAGRDGVSAAAPKSGQIFPCLLTIRPKFLGIRRFEAARSLTTS